MLIILVGIGTFLFYLNAIPLKFAFEVRISDHSGFGAGLAPFEERFARRRALKRALGEKKHLPWKKLELDSRKLTTLPSLLRSTRYAIRHLYLERLLLIGSVSTPDAAQTALLCGCGRLAEGALSPILHPGALRIELIPDFSSGVSRIEICGMFSMRVGHIMLAALIGALDYGNGRITQWINTRLKIS